MELTTRQKEWVSRATAILAGLVLLYWAWGCISWGNGAWADESTQDLMNNADTFRKQRAAGFVGIMFLVPYLIAAVFGILGLGLCFLGFKPHKKR